MAAEKLFYEENIFKLVVYVETGCFGIFVVGGIIWEFFVRNSPTGAQVFLSLHSVPTSFLIRSILGNITNAKNSEIL